MPMNAKGGGEVGHSGVNTVVLHIYGSDMRDN